MSVRSGADTYRLNVSFTVRAGGRNQPLVQLQRMSLLLPPNNNYTALSAALTTARTQYEIGGFPFLLGQESNSSGVCLRVVVQQPDRWAGCSPTVFPADLQTRAGQTWWPWPSSAFSSLTKMEARSKCRIRSTSPCLCRRTPITGWPRAFLCGCISLRRVSWSPELSVFQIGAI